MLLLRSYTEKQQHTDTLAFMEGYFVLSAAKRDNTQEGSSCKVAPAMHVVLLSRKQGGLLPNMRGRIRSHVVGHPFSARGAVHNASMHDNAALQTRPV